MTIRAVIAHLRAGLRLARYGGPAVMGLSIAIGCSKSAPSIPPPTPHMNPDAQPAAAAKVSVARPIDRLDLFVRNAAHEFVELSATRHVRGGEVTWYVQRYDGRLRPLGPAEEETEMVVRMLNSFDLWALNDPDAPGAACRTVLGQRSCSITFNDYSLVMQVQSGRDVRVQRYTRLEKTTSNRSARALGDFVFEWARTRKERMR